MEFTNPVDGGSVMATMSAFARLVPAGFETAAARFSDGMINVVVEGTGTLFIDDVPFALTPGEIVVVPAWTERRFSAESDLVLISSSDRATQQKLSLCRREAGVIAAAIIVGICLVAYTIGSHNKGHASQCLI